jgi:hypothetical protein
MALSREQAGRRLRMVTINVRILTRLDLLGEEGPGPRVAQRALSRPSPPQACSPLLLESWGTVRGSEGLSCTVSVLDLRVWGFADPSGLGSAGLLRAYQRWRSVPNLRSPCPSYLHFSSN